MAGFAVNIEYFLKHPDASMPYKAGYEEDLFLRSLNLTLDDIEPRADGCTQVYTNEYYLISYNTNCGLLVSIFQLLNFLS